jgi:tetratricopeptide (TPR) repeat protein
MAPDDDAQRERALMLLEMRRPADARLLLEPLVAAAPSDASALVLLAECCRLEGDLPGAVALCQRAVGHAPADVGLLLDAAQVARLADDLGDAHTWAFEALEIAPDDLRALNVLTLVESALGMRAAALAHGTRALERAPDNVDLRVAYALALGANGRAAEATEQYAIVLEQDPTHVYALNNLAALRLDVGDLRRSAHLFGRALAIDPRLTIAAKNIDVAGVTSRRLLLTRFAVSMGVAGVAIVVRQPWLWILAAALVGWTAWSVTRVPAAILRRVTANIQGREIFGFVVLVLGLINTFGPTARGHSSVPGYFYLFGYGLIVTVGILAKRVRVDVALRRRGVRLPS